MTTRTKRFEIDDDDDFDENGILKDGKRVRVPCMMRDSADNVASVPRWAMDKAARMLGRDSATNPDWLKRQEGYNTYELDLANRWRGGVTDLRAGDVVTTSDGHGVVKSHENGRLVIADATKLDSETVKQSAYDSYDREISTAWMRTSDADKPRVGAECSYAGYPGHYERDQHGNLVCTPDDKSDKENALAGPLSDAERIKVKDEMYSAYKADLQNAWRP